MRKGFGNLAPHAQQEFAERLLTLKAATEPRGWETRAYNKQREPSDPRHHLPDPRTGLRCGCTGGDYKTWLLMTGRGFGKTVTGSNWVLTKGLAAKVWIAVCAPAFDLVQRVCFDGPSGIINQAQPGEITDYNKNKMKITLRNGTIIQGFSALKSDSVRGQNLSYCWFDELGMIQYEDFYYESLLPAMRGVARSQMLITTTPRRTKIIRDLVETANRNPDLVHFTRASSMENWKDEGVMNMIRTIEERYRYNKKLIQQELEGMLIEDIDGAFFSPEDFDKSRTRPEDVPPLRRVVVGVDPASSASRNADEHGIVVCGEGEDGEFYTLEDCSMRGTVEKILRRSVAAYYRWDCDLMVVEDQVAGDWFRHALYQEDPYVNYRPVHAMKSKQIRAHPLTPLVKDGKVHMVCHDPRDFEILEQQLVAMTEFDDRRKMHDDRGDAWVYAMRELAGDRIYDWKEVYGFVPCRVCGGDVNENTDKNCKSCGSGVIRKVKPKEQVSHLAVRWSKAYYNTCPAGHEFPLRVKTCPECRGSPESYLAAVAKATGNRGWLSYNGSNPIAGRRI